MKKWLVLLAATFMAGSANADEKCALHQVASLDLQRLADGAVVVPATIMGRQQRMLISISAPFSWIYADFGEAEGFKNPPPEPGNGSANPPHDIYQISEVRIGNATIKDAQFYRMKKVPAHSHDAFGQLSVDLLSKFDMEIDLKRNKINLFSQEHCPGNVVYWTRSPYAAIPFEADTSQHPNLPMELDGKQIRVALTLAKGNAAMSMEAAKRLFDLDKDSFRMTPIVGTQADHPKYRYPFGVLNIDGLLIKNPMIDLDPKINDCLTYDKGFRRSWCFGGADVYLGENELSQLHLFFAFKEGMLYVTPADAH
jgi:hypothetical protein